jgi:predicted metal-dependent hydrolase
MNAGMMAVADIRVGDVSIEVVRKHIKNINLSIHPPAGRVRISAPAHMELEAIRSFAQSKLGWIRKHQIRMRSLEREAPRVYQSGETHVYRGRPYTLKVMDHQSRSSVTATGGIMKVRLRGRASPTRTKQIVTVWLRARLRELGWEYITKWEPVLGVRINELGIRAMKTRWGTCNARAGRIWLNLELIKKPSDYVEYLVVHEMAHLHIRGHGRDFKTLMDRHVPGWKRFRQILNKTPLRS